MDSKFWGSGTIKGTKKMLKVTKQRGKTVLTFPRDLSSMIFPFYFVLVISTFVDLLLVTFYLILSAALTSFSSWIMPRRAMKTAIKAANGNIDANAGWKLKLSVTFVKVKPAKHAYQTTSTAIFQMQTALCRLRLR